MLGSLLRGRGARPRVIGPDDLSALHGTTLVLAPNRAGSGTCLQIPTLLSRRTACVAWDVKGELCATTSGWRKSNVGEVFAFDPLRSSSGGSSYSPLEDVRWGHEQEWQDLFFLCRSMAGEPKSGQPEYVGTFLALFFKMMRDGSERTPVFAQCLDALNGSSARGRLSLKKACYDFLVSQGVEIPVAEFSDNFEERFQAVINTLAVFSEPHVKRNMSRSDFSFWDFANEQQTVYVISNPNTFEILQGVYRGILDFALYCFVQRNVASEALFALLEPGGSGPRLFFFDSYPKASWPDMLLRAYGVGHAASVYGNEWELSDTVFAMEPRDVATIGWLQSRLLGCEVNTVFSQETRKGLKPVLVIRRGESAVKSHLPIYYESTVFKNRIIKSAI